jgi:peptidoglycan/LPS O-acetylase OafA/YrhL
MPASPRALRADIQFLRALAVASVVAFHFHLPGADGGFMGVDVFFVISGYLMTRIVVERLERDRFSYLEFVMARAVRIVPALLALVGVLLVVGAVWLPPHDLKSLASQAWSALFFTSNRFYLDHGGYFGAGTFERWLLHTWSLSVEWQFYLLYPLLLAAIWAVLERLPVLRTVARRDALAKLGAAALVLLFVGCLAVSRDDPARAFYSLATRAWEMLGGGVVFLLEERMGRWPAWRRRARPLFAALVVALLAYMLFGAWRHLDDLWPGPWPLPAVLITMGLLAAGRSVEAGWVAHRLPQAVGRWSYSIYLWHWPIITGLEVAAFHAPLPVAWVVAGIAASVVLGALSFRWIEQPTSRIAIRFGGWRTAFALVLCGLSLQGASRLIERSEGWLARTGTDRSFYEQIAMAKDRPVMPADCQNHKRSGAALRVCSLHGEVPGPRVLVYGDSHAQHLYAWFDAHGVRAVDFLTSSGCPPAPGFNRVEPGFHCDEYMRRVTQLATEARYDTIVVAGNWASGMHSEHPKLCQVAAHGGCSEGTAPTRAALVEANVRFWRSLVAAGKKVYVLDQMPFANFDVPTQLARERFWHQPLTRTYRLRQHDPRPYLADVASAMGPSKGFERLDTARLLCDEGRCSTLAAGDSGPTLIDNNHFAPAFMRQNAQPILAAVR